MNKHEWRERTDSGETRLVRATHHAHKWKLQARLKSESEWTLLDPPPLDDLRELHEVMARKYTRGRVPHGQVLQLEAMIEEREEQED